MNKEEYEIQFNKELDCALEKPIVDTPYEELVDHYKKKYPTTILERLIVDRDQARKDGNQDKLSTYQVILGEIDRHQDKTDNGVIKILKSLFKSYQTTYDLKPDNKLAVEIQTILSYIPSQLSKEELSLILIRTKPSTIGEFMNHLKKDYHNQYDGKLAAEVWKNRA